LCRNDHGGETEKAREEKTHEQSRQSNRFGEHAPAVLTHPTQHPCTDNQAGQREDLKPKENETRVWLIHESPGRRRISSCRLRREEGREVVGAAGLELREQ